MVMTMGKCIFCVSWKTTIELWSICSKIVIKLTNIKWRWRCGTRKQMPTQSATIKKFNNSFELLMQPWNFFLSWVGEMGAIFKIRLCNIHNENKSTWKLRKCHSKSWKNAMAAIDTQKRTGNRESNLLHSVICMHTAIVTINTIWCILFSM